MRNTLQTNDSVNSPELRKMQNLILSLRERPYSLFLQLPESLRSLQGLRSCAAPGALMHPAWKAISSSWVGPGPQPPPSARWSQFKPCGSFSSELGAWRRSGAGCEAGIPTQNFLSLLTDVGLVFWKLFPKVYDICSFIHSMLPSFALFQELGIESLYPQRLVSPG